MEFEMEQYLKPTQTIESDAESIIEKANTLTIGCVSAEETAKRLFYFVRDEIRYNIYMASVFIEDFKASRILAWGKGYCVQKAVLLAALGRAARIPSRLVFAKIRNHRVPEHIIEKTGSNVFPRHGYNQFFLNEKWVSAAATFDQGLCKKNNLPAVEFDGQNDAILPEKDLSGNLYIEYIEKFPPRGDLPFDWIREKISQKFGADKRPWLNKNQKK
ncbi:MAG: transglutaminase-like domain-containing protein [Desulfobacterales bacterium]